MNTGGGLKTFNYIFQLVADIKPERMQKQHAIIFFVVDYDVTVRTEESYSRRCATIDGSHHNPPILVIIGLLYIPSLVKPL